MSDLAIPKIECIETSGNFGRFLAEPLEKGFGTTLGNAMRRALLGYLPGAAVTQLRLNGLQHEFSAIPFVKEDTVDLFLNIKAMRLKPLSGQPGKLILEVEGERQVFASDIQPSTDFEITNPELYLATLDSPEARLFMELDVELGTGYRMAESSDDLPVGTIPVDAIFAPVRKANFTIEPIHVGREASYERLSLEVWTDGTISPADALVGAANILLEQFAPFVAYGRVPQIEEEKEALGAALPDDLYNMPVEKLSLSVRSMNCLRGASITTVGELFNRGQRELLSLRNFGQKSMRELEERLGEIGLSLFPEEETKSQPEEKSEGEK